MIGMFAVTCASTVMEKMKSNDTNVPLRGFLRAASVTYVRSSTKPNIYRALTQSAPEASFLGNTGMDAGKMHARASTAAPTKTIIQSSVVNCLSQDFIDFLVWFYWFKVSALAENRPKIAQYFQ